jgi:hypothetical protein
MMTIFRSCFNIIFGILDEWQIYCVAPEEITDGQSNEDLPESAANTCRNRERDEL